MDLTPYFSKIFADITELEATTKLSGRQIGAIAHSIIRGETPTTELNDTQLDSVYRLVWAGFIRPLVRDSAGIVTSMMQWELIESGAMSIDELEADCLNIEQFSPAFLLPSQNLGMATETSANAILEVLRFDGADLRALVEIPLLDFRQPMTEEEFAANKTWNAASEETRTLLTRGDLGLDFLAPTNQDEFIYRFRQTIDLNLSHSADQVVATALQNELEIDPKLFALAKCMSSAMIGDLAAAQKSVNDTDFVTANDETIDFALEAAYILQTRGDADTAMVLFAKLPISPTPDIAMRTLYELALAQSHIERYDEALVNINRAIEFVPENALCHTMRGFVLNRLERTAEAIEEYDIALEINPYDMTALNNRGEIYFEDGQFERSIEDFDTVLNHEEKFRSRFFRTKALVSLERFDEAIEQTTRMLFDLPADREILLLRANAFEALGNEAGAISDRVAVLRYSLETDELAFEARDGLRRLRYELPSESDDDPWPRDPYQQSWADDFSEEDALAIDDYALEINDHLHAGHPDLAEEAVADFFAEMEAVGVTTHYTFLKRAQIRVAQERFEEAIEDVRKAIEIEPRDRFNYVTGSDAYKALEQFDSVIELLTKSIEIYPYAPEYWYSLNYAYEMAGQLEKSLETANKGLELDPGHQDLLYNSARLLTEFERYDEGIERYAKLLSINPNDAEAQLNLGVAYLQQGNVEDAVTNFEKAIEIRPDYAFAYQKLALSRTNYSKSNVDYAVAIALVGEENTPEVFYEMMDVHRGALAESGGSIDHVYLQAQLDSLYVNVGVFQAINTLIYLEGVLGDTVEYWMKRADLAGELYSDEGDVEAEHCLARAADIAPDHPGLKLHALQNADTGEKVIALSTEILDNISELENELAMDALREIPEQLRDWSGDHETNARLIQTCREGWVERFGNESYVLTSIIFKLALETDLAGDQEGSIALYSELIERDPAESTYVFNRACEYGYLGRADEAIADLEAAIKMNEKWRDDAQTDDYFDPIRSNPEFVALTKS